jgi:hypothetical protein
MGVHRKFTAPFGVVAANRLAHIKTPGVEPRAFLMGGDAIRFYRIDSSRVELQLSIMVI